MSQTEKQVAVGTPIDLSNCEREPIRVPGHIQPHGSMIVVDTATETIVQTSSNVAENFGSARTWVGATLHDCFSADAHAVLSACLLNSRLEGNPQLVFSGDLGTGRTQDVTAHLYHEQLILESEPRVSSAEFPEPLAATQEILRALHTYTDLPEFCRWLAAEIRRISGFDRVMIYRFSEDWHGWVFSESKIDELDPFLDLHYPASDIPAQARALFGTNRVRMIVNTDYQGSLLDPQQCDGAPTDLSHSFLRGVSPLHTEYLNNMGVGASLTLALPRQDKLWGLVACHHNSPRHVPFALRTAFELISQSAALRIGELESRAELAVERITESKRASLVGELAHKDNLIEALVSVRDGLRGLVDASGLVIVLPEGSHSSGLVPPPEAVAALAAWLHGKSDVVQSHKLGLLVPELADHKDIASGLLAVPIAHSEGAWILWFRSEQIRSVTWAGNPSKPVEVGPNGNRLTPRKSFELWSETVDGEATPWSVAEIGTADRLRSALGDVLLRERAHLQRLMGELEKRNEELDLFSTMASHDLREPLRGIASYASFLREDASEALEGESIEHLDRISKLVERLHALIEGLLSFSRMGRESIQPESVNLDEMVDRAQSDLAASIRESSAVIRTVGTLPVVNTWPLGIAEILANLISNAIKYSEGQPQIEIGVDPAAQRPASAPHGGTVLYVRDLGIGIDPKHHDAVFQVFHRLQPSKNQGSGMGLPIVRKLIERLGGAVWLESKPGTPGTTFFVAIPELIEELSA